MKITEKIDNFVNNVLDTFEEKRLFIWLPPCGLGDKITCFPAFRQLKTLYPDYKIILITEPLSLDIWKVNKYIDFVFSEDYIKGVDNLLIRENLDIIKKCTWSFFEHHQKHVVKTCIEKITGQSCDDDVDLTYEFNISEKDLENAKKHQDDLLSRANGKKIVAIAPANTMLSRMWPGGYWHNLTKLLQKEKYYVVSLGGKSDLDLKNVDYDARNKYPIRMIPKILDVVHCLINVNSGMLHIGSVNQDVNMIHLNTGQYPEKIMLPFRKNNNKYHNRIVINHECPDRYDCFEGHITEREIDKQTNEYINQFRQETKKEFPEQFLPLLQKFTCWYYCLHEDDKYSCNKQITPEKVLEAVKYLK